jgi:gliding motility-associated-like protein
MRKLYTYLYCKNAVSAIFTPLIVILIFISSSVSAQMVGPSAYVQGTSVEYAIDGSGGYEGVQTGVSPTPGGYHFRSNNNIFGFVSNPQLNGWASFDGDFFTPGSPENGWGIEIIDGGTDLVANNNCASPIDIPGSITAYTINGLCRIVTWEGNYINGGYNLHLKIDYVLMTPDLYYTTVVTVTNNGLNIPDFYYHRNFDPDNNVSINGSDYSTQNTIVSQPGSGCNKAHVRATSTNPGSQPLSYVGLAGVGANFRAIYGGFSNRDASDIWNGIGFTQTSGSTNFADEAIALSYRIQNLAPGTTQQFRFVVILDDLAANNAVNNLFTFSWPGSPSSTSTQCNPITDTITICNGMSTPISINGSALADFNWSWSPTLGLSPTTGPTVNANPSVNTLYTVTGTPINPCFNPVTQQIYVRVVSGTTNANAGPDQVLTCTTSSVNLVGSSTSPSPTYSWAGPGFVSSVTNTSTVTVNTPGTYILTVTSGGCSISDTVLVTQNITPPNANAGADMQLTCLTTSVVLGGSSSTGGATATWTGPGIVSGGSTFTPTVNVVGNYTVTVTNPANGCTSTDVAAVTLNNTPPNANAGPDMSLTCAISTINLAGSSSTPGATFSWAGPGITAGGATATPTVNVAGAYTVTVTDPVNGCTSTDVANVTGSVVIPNANAGSDMTLTCVTTSLNLAGSSSTPGATCVWAGPGIVAGGSSWTPTVNVAGTYTVTVTNPANGCTATDVAVVNVNNTPPNANAGPDQVLNCLVTSLNLAGSSSTGGATFAWGGPGISGGGATATPTIIAAGTYTVTVTNPANGCTSTDMAVVTLNNTAPNANAGADMTLNCIITSLNLSGSSSTGGVTCFWGGPGIVSGGATWTPNINGAGTYTITVTDPSNGCTATDQAVVNLNNTAPNAVAGPDQVLSCSVTSVSLAGSSTTGGVTCSWGGPGIVSGGSTWAPVVNTAGTYTITVTDPVNGCTNTDQALVTMNGVLPNANAGNDDTLNCLVAALNLSGSSLTAGVNFVWAGPGITANGNTATPTVNLPGTYTVTVTDPTNGCSSTDVADVIQNITPPGANAGLDDILNCVVLNLNLNGSATAPGATFAWTGPGIVSGGATNTPNINAAGSYTLTTTDPVNGCTSTDVVDITLNNTPPDITMGTNQHILCNTPVVNLTTSSLTAGVTYAWTGAGIIGSSVNDNMNTGTAGTYTVTITDPSNGCTSTGTVDAILDLNYPTASFFADNLSGCAPLCATLSDNSLINGSPIVGWYWQVESQGTATTSGGTFCFTNPGSYDVTLTVTTIDGCTATLSLPNYLTVNPNPTADFLYTPEAITEFDPLVIFGNTSYSADTYFWDFGDGGTSTTDSPNHMYADTGTYCITLLSSTVYGCTDTVTHCLYIAPEFNVFIPNSFTVNDDGLNEIWSVVGRGVKSFEARIFDRWGEELYFFDNIDKGWDGTRQNGSLCQQGVYVYKILITDGKGDFHEYIGNVNLIR